MSGRRSEQALTDLVRDRGEALTRYAYLLTGDVAAAQDLVQDALVKVFVRTRTGFAPDVMEAYVRRAIVNVYLDGHRRAKQWTGVQTCWSRPRQTLARRPTHPTGSTCTQPWQPWPPRSAPPSCCDSSPT